MLGPMIWILATAIAMPAAPPEEVQRRIIDVDCASAGALERALVRAEKLGEVEIRLDGVCTGNFVITSDGVTLRGATPDSGVAAPVGNPGHLPVIKVAGAKASLRALSVQGIEGGILVEGWDAEVLLSRVDVHNTAWYGVYASRGAHAQLLDTTLRSGGIGLLVESNSTANLQRVIVSNQLRGVVVSDRSFAAISDTTIENSFEGGLLVSQRSDATVLGGVFRNNSQVHMSSNDWSRITLLNDPVVGSTTDSTEFALGTIRYATIVSYGTSEIYGHASALIGGALQLGNTVLHGDLVAVQFANAHVRNAEITGIVVCVDGADVICSGATTAGAFGCPSTTCGPATAEAIDRAPSVSTGPVLEESNLDVPEWRRLQSAR
jgi:hypothetical protein